MQLYITKRIAESTLSITRSAYAGRSRESVQVPLAGPQAHHGLLAPDTALSRKDGRMELRSVEELMELLHAGRPRHALRTAALLRRGRPADKELQVAGLVQGIGPLPGTGGEADSARRAAAAVRPLLGERVFRLLRGDAGADEDVLRLSLAREEARTAGFDAGVLEDWRTVLELVAARHRRLDAVD